MTKRQEWEVMIKEVESLPDSYTKRSILAFLNKYKPKQRESRKMLPCTCGSREITPMFKFRPDINRGFICKCDKCGRQSETFKYEIQAIRNWNEMIKKEMSDANGENAI